MLTWETVGDAFDYIGVKTGEPDNSGGSQGSNSPLSEAHPTINYLELDTKTLLAGLRGVLREATCSKRRAKVGTPIKTSDKEAIDLVTQLLTYSTYLPPVRVAALKAVAVGTSLRDAFQLVIDTVADLDKHIAQSTGDGRRDGLGPADQPNQTPIYGSRAKGPRPGAISG